MNKKRNGFYIQIEEDDRIIIDLLRNKYSINVSHLIKKLLKEYLDNIEKTREFNK